MSRSSEAARIEAIARLLGSPRDGVLLGIGDDAAVLEPGAGARLVWTIDEQVEGTHFRLDLLSFEDLGWRSYMAAASDLAAMGAKPYSALSALALSPAVDDVALYALVAGQRAAADAVGAPIIGGNLARGPVVSITTTLLGSCAAPVTRGGGRAGDGLWLAGAVGLAAAGFRALSTSVSDPALAPAIAAWRRPRARIADGLALAGVAHAAIDVSDGLARDAGHLALASGLAVVLDEAAILDDGALLAAARALGASPLELALGGGEDYALVAASDLPLPGFRRIGELREGRGLSLRTQGGREEPLVARGFDHFTDS